MKKSITLFMTGLLVVMMCPMSVFAKPNPDVYYTSKRNDNTTFTVSIETNGKATDGISEISFDADVLSCDEKNVVLSEDIDMYSVNVTEGKVKVSYISEEPVKAGKLMTVTFEVSEDYADKEVSASVSLIAFDKNDLALTTSSDADSDNGNNGSDNGNNGNNGNGNNNGNSNNNGNGNNNGNNNNGGNNNNDDKKLDIEKPETPITLPVEPPIEIVPESVPSAPSVEDNNQDSKKDNNKKNNKDNNKNNEVKASEDEKATEEAVESTTVENISTQEATGAEMDGTSSESSLEEAETGATDTTNISDDDNKAALSSSVESTSSNSVWPFVVAGVLIVAAVVVGCMITAKKKAKQGDK